LLNGIHKTELGKMIKHKTILVTGGAGFIGSHIVEIFSKDNEVVVLDNLSSGFEKNISSCFNAKLVKGSVTDEKVVDELMQGVDYVFHLAALVSVPESMNKPVLAFQTNTLGTLNVLRSALKHKVKKVVMASSAAIYGNNPKCPKKETMLPEPISPYAISKMDLEYLGKMFHELGLDNVCLRFFNVFGPRQNPNAEYAAAIPRFITKALKNETITIFGDGKQTRDFIYVKDVVNACELALKKGSGVYNIGMGKEITITQTVETICKLAKSKSNIKFAPKRAGDVNKSLADISKAKKELGFKPNKFESGLKETIADYKKQI
jgi:UDP-glucose 4-epimerase